jgi:uncharacterized protein YjbJ (UPF0337 family)
MNTNKRIEGIGHQVKGAVMESLGIAIGDAKLAADGSSERALGDAQNSPSAGGDQLVGIDTDRILGIGHQFKGALIEELGRLVGNPKLQAIGTAERGAGKEQNVAGGARDLARQAAEKEVAGREAGASASVVPLDGRPKP